MTSPDQLWSSLRHYLIRLHHNRCIALFSGLLLFLLILPFVYDEPLGRLFLFALYVVLMISVVRSIRPRGWALTINVGLGVVYFVLVSAGVLSGLFWLKQAGFLAALLFLTGVMLALLRYVMDLSRVTTDKLFGSVTIYILLAFFFSDIFFMIESAQPGNFSFNVQPTDGAIDWSDFLYFSFTVLTSTGFGEITPVSRLARSLVIIQEVTGVMYVAFLIARLTELYANKDRR